eukprot:gene2086-biopygen13999
MVAAQINGCCTYFWDSPPSRIQSHVCPCLCNSVRSLPRQQSLRAVPRHLHLWRVGIKIADDSELIVIMHCVHLLQLRERRHVQAARELSWWGVCWWESIWALGFSSVSTALQRGSRCECPKCK